jgi:hypothetical protein
MATLSTTALALAEQFAGDDKRAYAKAKLVADAVKSNLSVRQIAEATSEARVKLDHPTASGDTLAGLVNLPGYKVSASQIGQYKVAWELVVLAGLTPSADTVNAAFQAVARGASSELSEFRATVAAGTTFTDETFVSSMLDAKRSATTRKAATRVAKETPNESGETVQRAGQDPLDTTPANTVPESIEVVLAGLTALAKRDWTETETASILSTMDDVYSALIEHAKTFENVNA